MWYVLLAIVIIAIIFIRKTIIIVPMREEVIKERMGKFTETLKPGFHFMVPFIDNDAYHREMRERVLDVPSQSCITSDNIQVDVDGLIYIKVIDAYKASYGIGNYKSAAVNLAQTTMRSEIGKMTLDSTFSERDRLNEKIVKEVDRASDSWGIKVLRYELKNISPSQSVEDTMEKQMEAERSKRAEITLSTGEKESRIKISEGERAKAINISEGEKIKRINEAEGRAVEIALMAEASANGIRKVSEAIQKPGGQMAVRTQLVEQYIQEYEKIIEAANISVLPGDLANIKSLVKTIGAAASVKESV
ncbi:MAG: paraslipin [Fibrobacteria bacterium]|nr:paraslipin [Fibrobacteria bacterium]